MVNIVSCFPVDLPRWARIQLFVTVNRDDEMKNDPWVVSLTLINAIALNNNE